MRFRRGAWAVGSALAGALVGGALMLGGVSLMGDERAPPDAERGAALPSQRPRHATPVFSDAPRKAADASSALLAWSPDGLDRDVVDDLASMRAVRSLTTVRAGLAWMKRSRASGGAIVDDAPAGMAIPIEIATVRPSAYAPFVAAAERDLILSLAEGEVLLARTEARLRRLGEGATIYFQGYRARVAGIVSDQATNGYEMLMRAPPPRGWTSDESFLLVHMRKARQRVHVARVIRSHLDPGQTVKIRSPEETPFLRYGDAVLPQMLIKENFGEFGAAPRPDGTLEIDPAWRKRNIRTEPVPLLGEVTCHRSLFPQLRGALRDIKSLGIGYRVDPSQFAGCFGPRFISRDPNGRLSHHAWGIAIDINVSENAFGAQPNQDERVVAAMREWGFTWGGRWLIPDGMHFEWIAWP